MNREQLHALLARAKARIQHSEFVIVGSLAILGAVSRPPDTMVMPIDVDAFLKNDPQRTGELAEALGQGSAFEDESAITSTLCRLSFRRSLKAGSAC